MSNNCLTSAQATEVNVRFCVNLLIMYVNNIIAMSIQTNECECQDNYVHDVMLINNIANLFPIII